MIQKSRTLQDRDKTFRLTKFKGLNKSVDPQNIDDAEFADMINVELSENRALQSRLGFTKVIDHIDPVITAMRGLYKADWDDATSTLYSARSWGLMRNNEATGYEYWVGLLPNPTGKHVHFQRWKDRLLLLTEGETLNWIDRNESLKPVAYPQFQFVSAGSSATTGGSLKDSTGYQYNISIVLGDNYRDGETAGALPIAAWENPAYDPKNPPPGPRWLPEMYLQDTTTGSDKTIVFSSATYTGQLNGYDIGYIKLFRRECRVIGGATPAQDTYIADLDWVQIDTAFVKKVNNTYSLEANKSSEGLVHSLTGTYNATNDSATLIIGITDAGESQYVAVTPLNSIYYTIPQAKYMARVNNRIFLGNLVGSDTRDKKTVRFSYTGYLDTNGTVEEIPNFHYGYPMLLFGTFSWFYCDSEDTDDAITGMYGYKNSLIIFTGKCTFMWQEGMKDPIKISNDVGCIANETIREFEGRLIWLSTNGVVMYDGSKLKNLTQDKANSYITGLSRDYSWKATATIFNRKYYIAAPFYGGTDNACILVYDFDLDEWFERRYKITNETIYFFVDCFYKYNDGAKEVLYAGGHTGSYTTSCYIVKLDEGYNDGGALIECSIRTKYYDFGAPDIIKDIRAFNIDMTNYSGSLAIRMYLDNLNDSSYRYTHTGITGGFIVNDDTNGRVNADCIVNLSDEMFAFSLPMAQRASRVQYGLSFNAGPVQTSIRAISFDWRTVRKLQRKYGG